MLQWFTSSFDQKCNSGSLLPLIRNASGSLLPLIKDLSKSLFLENNQIQNSYHLSIFGPLLFLIYINDLPLDIKKWIINKFADDTAVFKQAIIQDNPPEIKIDSKVTDLSRQEKSLGVTTDCKLNWTAQLETTLNVILCYTCLNAYKLTLIYL